MSYKMYKPVPGFLSVDAMVRIAALGHSASKAALFYTSLYISTD